MPLDVITCPFNATFQGPLTPAAPVAPPCAWWECGLCPGRPARSGSAGSTKAAGPSGFTLKPAGTVLAAGSSSLAGALQPGLSALGLLAVESLRSHRLHSCDRICPISVAHTQIRRLKDWAGRPCVCACMHVCAVCRCTNVCTCVHICLY